MVPSYLIVNLQFPIKQMIDWRFGCFLALEYVQLLQGDRKKHTYVTLTRSVVFAEIEKLLSSRENELVLV